MKSKNKIVVVGIAVLLILNSISLSFALQTDYDLVYDANGNLISGYGFNHSYDGFNNLVNSTDSTTGGLVWMSISMIRQGVGLRR